MSETAQASALPPRGPRFSCPACGEKASKKQTGPALLQRATAAVVETYTFSTFSAITAPVLCEEGQRLKTGFWPWNRCTAAAEGKAESSHLHQKCQVCGMKWICKTVIQMGADRAP